MNTSRVHALAVAAMLMVAAAHRSEAQTVCTLTTPTLITEADNTYNGCDLVIDGVTVTMDGEHRLNSVTIIHGGVLTHSACTADTVHKLDMEVAGAVSLDGASAIDVSGKGYLAGRTKGNTAEGGAQGMAGGSYGGHAGRDAEGKRSNQQYGRYWEADEWGSGGGVAMGGSGGGLVRIKASRLVLGGRIYALGGAGGSGGGIDVRVGVLEGAGTMLASAGGGGTGASGGRVVAVANERAGFRGMLSAFGRGDAGCAGTVYERNPDEDHGTLTIDNFNLPSRSGAVEFVNEGTEKLVIADAVVVKVQGRVLTRGWVEFAHDMELQPNGFWRTEGTAVAIEGSLLFNGGGRAEVAGSLPVAHEISMNGGALVADRIQAPAVTLTNGATLTTFDPSETSVHKLEVEVAGKVTVDATSLIDARGKGYLAGRTKGNTTEGGAQGMAGGSYGGQAGCAAEGQCSNRAYGQYWEADECGSGGGGPAGGAGGGLVRIKASRLVLDGGIYAHGLNAGGGNSGGGSGGGVDIRVDVLEGAGPVYAQGAAGGSGSTGGRIVVVADDSSGYRGVLTAFGQGGAGSAGTAYVRHPAEDRGTLTVDCFNLWSQTGAVEFVNEGTEKLVIPDAVVVKAQGRLLTRGWIEFAHDMELQPNGFWRTEGTAVAIEGSLLFNGGGRAEVAGSLPVAHEISMNGGALVADRIQAPAVTLTNGATLTTFDPTATAVHKLEVEVDGTVKVDATSLIEVRGKGYLAGRTKGNTPEGGAQGAAGGSYGGQAGCAAEGQCSNRQYGQYWKADEWGSGGGGPAGGAGGGLVQIKAAWLVLDGGIYAHGLNAGGGGSGGGSGGGVEIRVDVLEGAGSVYAQGAAGGSGGSGGRIVVVAKDPSRYHGGLVAYGRGERASAGTIYKRNPEEAFGTLIVDNADLVAGGAVEFVNEGTEKLVIADAVVVKAQGRLLTRGWIDFAHDMELQPNGIWRTEGTAVAIKGSLLFNGGGRAEVAGSLPVAHEISMSGGALVADRIQAPALTLNGATLTTFDPSETTVHKLEVEVAGTLHVGTGSTINVNGKGYLAGRTKGNTTEGGAQGMAGGSYGGQAGCDVDGKCSNRAYGQYWQADEWGSGGGGPTGGTGGGLVRIKAGRLVLDGAITALGLNAGANGSGGGSGGGVNVQVDVLEGAGPVHALGTASGSGASGGRIVVVAKDRSGYRGGLSAFCWGEKASAGTVYERNPAEDHGTLTIDNVNLPNETGTVEFVNEGTEKLVIADAVVVKAQGRVLTRGWVEFAQGLVVDAGGWWVVDSGGAVIEGAVTCNSGGQIAVDDFAQLSEPLLLRGGWLRGGQLAVPRLTLVDGAVVTTFDPTASAVFTLDLRVAGTLSVDPTSRIDVSGKGYPAGRSVGNTTFGGSAGQAGGSYGGRGIIKQGRSNNPYGYFAGPEDYGSGGSDAPGGGLARIQTGRIELGGLIQALGEAGSSGGGSGGSIFIVTDVLSGPGRIQANGGPANSGAGGGGGRIALYARDYSAFDTNRIAVLGSQGAEAGTLFISQTPPTLHVVTHAPMGWNSGVMSNAIDHVLVQFNMPIDSGSLTATQFLIDGQMGRVAPTRITAIGDRTFEIGFPPLTDDGPYHFKLLPGVRDRNGLALDQNANGIPGESTDDFNWDLRLDTVAPRITRHEPAGDVTGTLDSVDVWFSEAIEWPTFTPADVGIKAPGGAAIAATKAESVGLNRLRVSLPGQTALGLYGFSIGPEIQDIAGNVLDQNRDGSAGQPDDIYTFTVNLTPVDLHVRNVVVNTNQLWAGDPVVVTWEGYNAANAPLLGNWSDAVFFSADDKWDINDVRLAVVPHTGGLTHGETYTGSATLYIPGALPGRYHLLLRSDIFNQESEGPNERVKVAPFGPVPLAVRELAVDSSPQVGTFSTSCRAHYFTVTLGPGNALKLSLEALRGGNGIPELYASFDRIPTRLDAEFVSRTKQQTQQLVLDGPAGSSVLYVLVYADQITADLPYELLAEVAPFFLTGITPGEHSDAPDALISLRGAGFSDTAIIEIVGLDGQPRLPASQRFHSPATFLATFDLTDWPIGRYDVRMTQDARTELLPKAFEVNHGFASALKLNLVLPSAVVFNMPIRQTIWIEYQNQGPTQMPAPLITLESDQKAWITADPTLAVPFRGFGAAPPGVGSVVQLLGLGLGPTPWLLQPGESARIPIYYIGLPGPARQVNFTASAITGDDLRSIDWSLQEPMLRPPDEDNTTWREHYASIQARTGTTWGDYVRSLNTVLGQIQPSLLNVNSIGHAWSALSSRMPMWLSALLQQPFERRADHVYPNALTPLPSECQHCAGEYGNALAEIAMQDLTFIEANEEHMQIRNLALPLARAITSDVAELLLLYQGIPNAFTHTKQVLTSALTSSGWPTDSTEYRKASEIINRIYDLSHSITKGKENIILLFTESTAESASLRIGTLVDIVGNANSIATGLLDAINTLKGRLPGDSPLLQHLETLGTSVTVYTLLFGEGAFRDTRGQLDSFLTASAAFRNTLNLYGPAILRAKAKRDLYDDCIEECLGTGQPPRVILSQSAGLTTTEDRGGASFTVRLGSRPTSSVTVTLMSTDSSEGLLYSPQSNTEVVSLGLLFSVDNWRMPQRVTVVGQDDDIVDGNVAYKIDFLGTISDDHGYNGLRPTPPSVALVNKDNDGESGQPGITVLPESGLRTSEDGSLEAYVSVVLNSMPESEVSIAVTTDDITECTVQPAHLVFDGSDWYEAQTITVRGVDDGDCDGDEPYHVVFERAVSEDTSYTGILPTGLVGECLGCVRAENVNDDTCDCSGNGCTQPAPLHPPNGPGGITRLSPVIGSFDPNDKLGSAGPGVERFVDMNGALLYRVLFENRSEATAPARWVTVTDIVDARLDIDRIELTEIAFADQRIRVPQGLSHYETQMEVILQGHRVVVDVEARVDAVLRTLTLSLMALDPLTGWFSNDPFVGLLFPEDGTGRGQGSISYLVYPQQGLATGTTIVNKASIVFDYNDPIETPTVLNTIDSGAPSSQVAALPAISPAKFTVQWSGQDDAGGSGIASYDVYVSNNGAAWTLWMASTTDTAGDFTGQLHHTYSFYIIARDYVGNSEAAPSVPDAVTTVNHAPVAGDDAMECDPDGTAKVLRSRLLANDSDPDGDPLTLPAVDAASPKGATITLDEDYVTYAAAAGYAGPDSFHYTVRDGYGGSAMATVNVTVKEPDQAPGFKRISLLDADHIGIGLEGSPGRTYGLESTADLGSRDWRRIATWTPGPDGQYWFVDTVDKTRPRFYRAVAP